jgi:hypothetical protein
MQFRGTCSVQCFRPAYHYLSLTPRTPCFLQPLFSPTTPHYDVLTAVSPLTMHHQYLSSYHNVRGVLCVSDTHTLGTTALYLREFSERGYCYVSSHHIGSFIFALLASLGVLVKLTVTHLAKTCSTLFVTWSFVTVFKTGRNWIEFLGTIIIFVIAVFKTARNWIEFLGTIIISVTYKLQIYRKNTRIIISNLLHGGTR